MSVSGFKLGVVAAALSADVREAARLSRENGFGGIALDALSPQLDVTQLSQSGRRELRHMLAAHEQALVALRVDAGARGLGPGADVDRILARMLLVMEAVKALATEPLVCFDLGPLPEPPAEEKSKPRVTPQQAGLIIIPEPAQVSVAQETVNVTRPDPAFAAHIGGALRELGDLADRVGVTVAFRSELAGFAALERALGAALCPWFGIDLDPVALLRDAGTADEIFSRVGPLIRHVRGRDATVGADRRTKPAVIGHGSTGWPALLNDLDAAAFHGWITIDSLELTDRTRAAIAGAKHIRASVP